VLSADRPTVPGIGDEHNERSLGVTPWVAVVYDVVMRPLLLIQSQLRLRNFD